MQKPHRSNGRQAKRTLQKDSNLPEWRREFEDAQKALGTMVRKLRLRKGWTQEEFADKCGVHHSWISKIERGKANPRVLTITNLAAHLEVTTSALMKGIA